MAVLSRAYRKREIVAIWPKLQILEFFYYFQHQKWILNVSRRKHWKSYQGKIDDIWKWKKSWEFVSPFWLFSVWTWYPHLRWTWVSEFLWSASNLHEMGDTVRGKPYYLHDLCIHANVLHICTFKNQRQ